MDFWRRPGVGHTCGTETGGWPVAWAAAQNTFTSHPVSRAKAALAAIVQAPGDEPAVQLVNAFLESHGGELDDPAVVAYVHGLLSGSEAQEGMEVLDPPDF